MTPPSLAQQERTALCDLFVERGSDAPTLCEGWFTADLAAHLVVRERRPDSGPGLVWPPLAGYTDKVRRSVRDRMPWGKLVETVRRGPPLLLRPFDGPMNTVEFFIHVEDVRRCARRLGTPAGLLGVGRCPLGARRTRRDGEEDSRHDRDHLAGTGRQGGWQRAAPHPGRRPGRAHHVRSRSPTGSQGRDQRRCSARRPAARSTPRCLISEVPIGRKCHKAARRRTSRYGAVGDGGGELFEIGDQR